MDVSSQSKARERAWADSPTREGWEDRVEEPLRRSSTSRLDMPKLARWVLQVNEPHIQQLFPRGKSSASCSEDECAVIREYLKQNVIVLQTLVSLGEQNGMGFPVPVSSLICHPTLGLAEACVECTYAPKGVPQCVLTCFPHWGVNGCPHGERCSRLHMDREDALKSYRRLQCRNHWYDDIDPRHGPFPCPKRCPYAHSRKELRPEIPAGFSLADLLPGVPPLVKVLIDQREEEITSSAIAATAGALRVLRGGRLLKCSEQRNCKYLTHMICDYAHPCAESSPLIRSGAGGRDGPERATGHTGEERNKQGNLQDEADEASADPEVSEDDDENSMPPGQETREVQAQETIKHVLQQAAVPDLLEYRKMYFDGTPPYDDAEFESFYWESIPTIRDHWKEHVKGTIFYSKVPEDHPRYVILWQCCLGTGTSVKGVYLGFDLLSKLPVAIKVFKPDAEKVLGVEGIERETSFMRQRKGLRTLVDFIALLELVDPFSDVVNSKSRAIVMECLNSQLAGVLPLWKEYRGKFEHVFWLQSFGKNLLQAGLEVTHVPDVSNNILVPEIAGLQPVVLEKNMLATCFFSQELFFLPSVARSCKVHRDISPRNIMIDVFGNIKFIDVGVSRLLAAKHAQHGRTVIGASIDNGFVAPEMLMQMQSPNNEASYSYSVDSDVYSLGRTMLSLMICTMENISCLKTVKEQVSEFQEAAPHSGWLLGDLIKRMTKKVPSERLSLADALRHPFFWSSDTCISFIANVGSWLQNLSENDHQKQKAKITEALGEAYESARTSGLHAEDGQNVASDGRGWWKLFGDSANRFRAEYLPLGGAYDDARGWISLLTMVRDHAPGHHQKFLMEPDSSMLLDYVPFLTACLWKCVAENHRKHPNFRFVFQ